MNPSERGGPARHACSREAFQRGFTYLWMLLMVALMGIGLVLASDVQTTASQRDRETELMAIGQQFRYALSSYYQAQQPGNSRGMAPDIPVAQAVSSGSPPAAGAFVASVSGAPPGPAATSQIDPLRYPATLDELLKDNRFAGLRRHLRKVFVDPMTRKAEWGLVQVSGRIVGIHSLSTAVPIKQAGFDDENQSFTGAQTYAEWVFGLTNQLPTQASATATGSGGASIPFSEPGKGGTTNQPAYGYGYPKNAF